MARYPSAMYRPLAKVETQPAMKAHTAVVLHTMVGNLSSTDAMFDVGGWKGTESHFGVGGIWGPDAAKGYDGKVFQWQDTGFTADANLEGNPRVISIETADNAPRLAKDIQPWTTKQLDAIVKLVAWICKTHNIPATLMHDSKTSTHGIGYHQLGVEHSLGIGKVPGFLVPGGERWSTARGKECPGPQRIAQVKGIIVPRVAALLKAPPVVVTPSKPVVSKVTDFSDYTVTLSSVAQVNAMNSNLATPTFVLGDVLDIDRLMRWGGPGMERILNHLIALGKAQEDTAVQLHRIEDLLTKASAKLADNAPTGEPRSV